LQLAVTAAAEDKNFCCKKMQWQVCTMLSYLDDTILNDIVLGDATERVSNIFSDIDVWTFNLAGVLASVGV
jgi:hypothetical protein